jgi:hypothetical protein
MRRVGVHELVDGDAKNDRDDERDERDRVARGVLDGALEAAGQEVQDEQDEGDEKHRVRAASGAAVSTGYHFGQFMGAIDLAR